MIPRFIRLISATALLAGCGGTASPASPASVSASPAVAPSASAKPQAAASAKPSASASAAPKPASGGNIKVGVLEPLTGSFASTAKDNQDGYNLYLSTV